VTRLAGTCATGSLIIAIIQFLRLILEYLDRKRTEMEENGYGTCGIVWRFIFCCLRCCLWAMECCMKWLNKNIYVQTILHNSWFCASACRTMVVMLTHITFIMVTKPIAAAFLFFGKLAIAAAATAFGGFMASSLDVTSIVAPVIVMFIISYAIAGIFVNVYNMGIDTMLMCFLEAKYSEDTACLPETMVRYASTQPGLTEKKDSSSAPAAVV